MPRSILIVNLIWLIGLLLLSIAALVVYKPDAEMVLAYVSFAAAISSILLAVVAIIYSFFSNNTLSSAILQIQKSASEISSETGVLKSVAGEIEERTGKLINSLEEVPNKLGDVELGVRALLDHKSDRDEVVYSVSKVDNGEIGNLTNGIVLTLYMISKSFKAKCPFFVKSVIPEEQNFLENYFNGSISAIKDLSPKGIRLNEDGRGYLTESMGSIDPDSIIAKFEKNFDKEDKTWRKFLSVVQKIQFHFDSML